MTHRIDSFNNTQNQPMSLRCPGCRQQGVFEAIGVNDIVSGHYVFGHRRCPNPRNPPTFATNAFTSAMR